MRAYDEVFRVLFCSFTTEFFYVFSIHKHNHALALALAATLSFSASLKADESHDSNGHKTHRADGHAPIGVMGDHLHKKGEFMMSYRFMTMGMKGNQQGTDNISTDTIATTIPNRFFGTPGQPQTVRVVPTEMTMDMHMLGVMYAPTDQITLMGMVNYVEKDMEHVTFQGGVGSTELGRFRTKVRGLSDTRLAALIKLGDSHRHRWHATLGVSLPTGSNDETDDVLTPMNTRPTLRLPYPMQLGSGTYDVIAGVTYAGNAERWGWGGQWQSDIRLSENDEDYTLGDIQRLGGWVSYLVAPTLSISGRVAYFRRGNIDGMDVRIAAPVQTADPDRQKIRRVDVGVGANWVLPGARHRLALEVVAPVRQELDGPQLETDWHVTLGWQIAP